MNTRKVRNRAALSLLAVALAVGALVAANIVTTPLFGQTASSCVTGGAVAAGNPGLAADCETLLGLKGDAQRQRQAELVDGPPD